MGKSVWSYDLPSKNYDELNIGQWWDNAELEMIYWLYRSDISNHQHHYLFPVILFIDSTHCDRNRRLNAEPVLCSIGNINLSNKKSQCLIFLVTTSNESRIRAREEIQKQRYRLT